MSAPSDLELTFRPASSASTSTPNVAPFVAPTSAAPALQPAGPRRTAEGHTLPDPKLDPQQALLRWGIENATPGSLIPLAEEVKAGKRPDLNPEILKAIMGTSDAEKMRDCMSVIRGVAPHGEGATKRDKLLAWDDLEMLIEDLDNANDLQHNKLWEPITQFLSDPDPDFVAQACWVAGTAVQNNPKAQGAFLALDPLPQLSALLTSSSTTPQVRNKAMYCLSSTLKHSAPATDAFVANNGLATLTRALQDPSPTLRAKTAFLLSQLVSQADDAEALLAAFRSSGLTAALLDSVDPKAAVPTGESGDGGIDPDYREKALRVLVNAVEREGKAAFGAEEKAKVREVVKGLEADQDWSVDDLGMAQSEWSAFVAVLQ